MKQHNKAIECEEREIKLLQMVSGGSLGSLRNANAIIGYKSPTSVMNALRRLNERRLVRRGRVLGEWEITHKGIQLLQDRMSVSPTGAMPTVSRVSIATIRELLSRLHKLVRQDVLNELYPNDEIIIIPATDLPRIREEVRRRLMEMVDKLS